ncbi:hypothetical protein V8B97DRAFT_1987087 [Scleroderma yunnanense]
MLPCSTRIKVTPWVGAFLLVIMALEHICTVSANTFIHPQRRSVISEAQCVSGFNWMNNQEGSSPCLVVAYVIAACVGDTWTQPVLPAESIYDAPNGTTATPCYCSWSCYNLMMACEWCQYPNNVSLSLWTVFSQNCPSSYTNEYFPSGYTLLDNETIPFWASIDPTKWTSGFFDVSQAQGYSSQGVPDLKPSASSTNSASRSSNLGPIIGGTVGGAALIITLAFGIYCFCKRRKYRRLANTSLETDGGANPTLQLHARQSSDRSVSSLQSGIVSPAPISYFSGARSPLIPSTRTSTPSIFTSFPTATPPPRTYAGSFITSASPPPGLPAV